LRAIVLGATGFIGGQIVRAAVERGLSVRGLRRQADAVGAVGDLSVEWHEGDLDNRASLARAMRGCDLAFHAAGYYPWGAWGRVAPIREQVALAVRQMRNVLDAAREVGVERVVYTSSISTVGKPPPGAQRLADEDDWYVPGSLDSAYFECKWAMEMEAHRAVVDGLAAVVIMPAVVMGPGDVKPTTGQMVVELLRGRLPVGADVELNVVDARDLAEAHLSAAERGEPGQRYIVGGHNVNMADVLRRMAELAGVRPPRLALSAERLAGVAGALSRIGLPIADTVVQLDQWQPLNAERARRELGFDPRPLDDTLRDTIDWFRNQGRS
jgi:dihydroflavonol-4-reductase